MSAGQDPLFSLADRVVVVTGGAGMLGRQFAKTLLARGAKVAVFDAVAVDRAAKHFGGQPSDASLHFEQVDVADRDSLVAALARTEAALGTPNGLINAAAIDAPPDSPATGPFETYPV